MRRNELDYVLGTMLDSYKDVSDLKIKVDKPLQVESACQLAPVTVEPPIEKLTPFQTETLAMNLVAGNRRLTEDLLRTGSCDSSYTLTGKARFRVNIFSQRGNYSIVLRKLATKIPTLAEMKLPDIFHQMAKEKTGLVLVTGATGSGKSTTLAALLNEINETKSIHIITLEDPVELLAACRKALDQMGYKVHPAASHAEFLSRFAQIQYQVALVEDVFDAASALENRALTSLQAMPLSQRRHAVSFLLGRSFQTLNPMQAFQQSVHAVVNAADLDKLPQIVQKVTADNDLFYNIFRDSQSRLAQGK
jgi:energy-coupling factor transporter ATP-binding protein EcfA2